MSAKTDPLEFMIASALMDARIDFTTPDERRDATGLDFRLSNGVEIEVKQFHSDRANRQLASAPNVILLQGREAVAFFCSLLAAAAALTPENA
jgi:hypothetical protein